MVSGLLKLLGLGPKPVVPPSVTNDEEHDRAYEQGAQLIFPRMQVLGRGETVSNKDKAKLRQGIAYMHAVIHYNPGNWGAYWIAGKAYQSMGDHVQANESFKSALDIGGENADIAREHAVSCLELGWADKAVASLSRAIKEFPNDSSLHAHLALAFVVEGKDKEACAAANKALEVGADDTMATSILQMIEDVKNGTRPRPRNMEELDLI